MSIVKISSVLGSDLEPREDRESGEAIENPIFENTQRALECVSSD